MEEFIGLSSKVPEPKEVKVLLPNGSLPYMSVIQNEKKPIEMLQISKEASLPTWMSSRKNYTKLDTPLHYELDGKSMQLILVAYTKLRKLV